MTTRRAVDSVRPADSVARIMTWPVSAASERDTLRRAAEALAGDEVGVLGVVEHGALVGIVSERDIIRHLADGANPDNVTVGEIMTTELAKAQTEDSIIDVARMMREEGVRHVPLLERGRITGMVSMRDLLDVFVASTEAETTIEIPPDAHLVLRRR